jgi:hypothetical protein
MPEETREEIFVTLKFSRDVRSLSELAAFAGAFEEIDRLKNRMIRYALRNRERLEEEEVAIGEVVDALVYSGQQLIAFQVGSQPSAKIGIVLSTLPILVALFLNYDKIGPNAQRIEKDFEGVVKQVEGLSESQRSYVLHEGRLFCSYFLASGEVFFEELARESRHIRERLNGSSQQENVDVHISVGK